MMIHDLFVSHILTFTQNVSTNIHGLTVTDNLQITQSVRQNIRYLSVAHQLGLSQYFNYRRSIANLTVTSQLNLTQDTERGASLQVVDFLWMWQIIKVENQYFILTDNLILTQTIDVEKVIAVVDTLTLTDFVTLNASQNYGVTDQLELTQTINVWNPRVDAIPVVEPIPRRRPRTAFVFGLKTIILRSPDFGNSERLDLARINRRSRAGNLVIFRDPSWPQSDVISMTFSNLTANQAHSLVEFMQLTLGKKVDYYDYLGSHWQGFILTPSAQVSEQYRNGFVISLEFQGDKV